MGYGRGVNFFFLFASFSLRFFFLRIDTLALLEVRHGGIHIGLVSENLEAGAGGG